MPTADDLEATFHNIRSIAPTSDFMVLFHSAPYEGGPKEPHLALYDLVAIGVGSLATVPHKGATEYSKEPTIIGFMLRDLDFVVVNDINGFLGIVKVGTPEAAIRSMHFPWFSLEDNPSSKGNTEKLTPEQQASIPIYHFSAYCQKFEKYTLGQMLAGGND